MGKVFVLMGKSATGKDTIYNKLISIKELNLISITGYTTRPKREGEKDGKEYNFVNIDELNKFRNSNKIIEERCYHTVYGDWFYFTADDGKVNLTEHSYIYIVTLEGYERLCGFFGKDNIIPIYIEVPDKERLIRAVERESRQKIPNYNEVCRRYLADEKDFSKDNLKKAGIEYSYINDNCEICFKEIYENIKNMI